MKSMTELAGGELCLTQRPHDLVGAARRRRKEMKWNNIDNKTIQNVRGNMSLQTKLGTTCSCAKSEMTDVSPNKRALRTSENQRRQAVIASHMTAWSIQMYCDRLV